MSESWYQKEAIREKESSTDVAPKLEKGNPLTWKRKMAGELLPRRWSSGSPENLSGSTRILAAIAPSSTDHLQQGNKALVLSLIKASLSASKLSHIDRGRF